MSPIRSMLCSPRITPRFQIPKCVKGQGISHSIQQFQGSKKIWMETKYDGERAQIHVQVDETGNSNITIFSKSTRDSTKDRFAVHSCVSFLLFLLLHMTEHAWRGHRVIRDALNLADPALDPQMRGKSVPRIKQDIILEAEMVAFSDTHNRIDGEPEHIYIRPHGAERPPEFWRIRSLIGSTAIGVRRQSHRKTNPELMDDDG